MFDIGELVVLDIFDGPYTGIVIDRFPKTGGDYGDRSYQIMYTNEVGETITEWRGDDGTFGLKEMEAINESR